MDGVETRYHKSISDIFKEKGETGFREIEKQALKEVSEFEDVIIATGGGTPCFYDNIEFMNNRGTTIYLKSSNEILFQRLKIASHNRPIIKDKSDEELKLFIAENITKREPFYSQAKLCFNADRLESKNQIMVAGVKLIELIVFSL